jgi:hypothetical protein
VAAGPRWAWGIGVGVASSWVLVLSGGVGGVSVKGFGLVGLVRVQGGEGSGIGQAAGVKGFVERAVRRAVRRQAWQRVWVHFRGRGGGGW